MVTYAALLLLASHSVGGDVIEPELPGAVTQQTSLECPWAPHHDHLLGSMEEASDADGGSSLHAATSGAPRGDHRAAGATFQPHVSRNRKVLGDVATHAARGPPFA